MDELRELIGLLADVPSLVVWVLAGYMGYKLVVVGSIYGVIRLLIDRTHSWLTRPKEVQMRFGDVCISPDVEEALKAQLRRLPTRRLGPVGQYMFGSDVDTLRGLIDEYEAKQR